MPSTYGELELPCLRSTQILTTLVIKLKYIKNLIKRCKKSQNKKKQLSTVYLANLLARAKAIPSKNIFQAVIAYQKTNICKKIHKPFCTSTSEPYKSNFFNTDSCESASCFIYLVKETKVAPSIFSG